MRFNEIISEAGSPAQQAAIAIAMKKAGKKPKDVAEGSVEEPTRYEVEIVRDIHGDPIGEIYLDHLGWAYHHYKKDYGESGFDSEEDAFDELEDAEDEYQQGLAEGENWSKYNHKRVGGMSKKSVSSYRRSHPGSKIQTAVTTKPSKLKKGSKAAKRRASFCARMRGMKKHRTSAKTARDPNSNINKSLRRWHCESIEQLQELVMLAEQKIRNLKK